MTLKDYIAFFDKTTETSNTVFRQLAFGAFAIVWLFKQEDKITLVLSIPKDFKTALLYFVVSLTADLLQYFISAVVNGLHALYLQLIKHKVSNSEFELHVGFLVPAWIFYVVKIVALFVGYLNLFCSILHYFK